MAPPVSRSAVLLIKLALLGIRGRVVAGIALASWRKQHYLPSYVHT
jgi:hypothetical protein